MQNEQPVVVVDIRMKFWSMVIFMIKLAFASIPAAIVITVVWGGMALLLRQVLAWVS